ncbi:MAG TPA: polysaccharide lyase family protein [Acidobacteriaceae bacterium]|nr:polysaccharide lyase family protein [Acidobacteriaceae bacterium]
MNLSYLHRFVDVLCGIALAACVVGSSLPLRAQTDAPGSKVFQIGVFDRSPLGFRGGQPKEPVTFVVGASDPAKDWYGTQPASSVAEGKSAEAAAAPRTIQFAIQGEPATKYRLHLALVLGDRAVPAIAVTINGRRGVFYLSSKLNSVLGGMDDQFESAYVPADVSIQFPGSYLHKGTNSIALEVLRVDEPANLPAGLNYDAIELDSLQATSASAQASIQPTVFYKRDGDKLTELVDVFVQDSARNGELDLELNGAHYKQPLHAKNGFGEERFEFDVPEFTAGTQAHLSWTGAGKTNHLDAAIDPQKKWNVLLVPHIHLDIGYSDYQAKVAAIQDRALDEAMDFTKQVPEFRYSTDGSWVLDQFMQTRSAADRERLLTAMRKQQIFVPAEYANLLTGLPTTETLIRSLYYSANFSREHGTPFNYANITDVPSYGWSYASVLAAAGIKYFVAGPNGRETHAPVLIQGHLNESSPFWWEGPDGKKVLFWYARHYWEMGIYFGTPPDPSVAYQTVPLLLAPYQRPGYRSDSMIVFGSQQENTDLFVQQATFAKTWNERYAYPKMEYSGFYDAMKRIAAPFGDEIPTVRGDGGPYWEDGIASAAELEATERRTESRAPSAEQLATVSSLVNPRLAPDKDRLDRMWRDMVLMDEHTWTSHDSVNDSTSDETAVQSAVKKRYAVDASSIADFVAKNSMASLADSISAGRGTLIVFNTLNWKRSGAVTFDLRHGEEIVDSSTGNVVAVETLHNGNAFNHVRFVARDVPGNGYKVLELRKGPAAHEPKATPSTVLENSFYRVTLDPSTGAVQGIFDKELKKELVNQSSPYKFGQYLYVTGGDKKPNSMQTYRMAPLPPELQVTGAREGRLISSMHTPEGWVARMESTDVNTPSVRVEIRLPEHEKKIEFVEDITKQKVLTKEAVYFAFPFAMDHPEFNYEIQNGVVNPAKDMYPGAGHEWFSVQHWVSVQQDGVSGTVMPLDAGLVTLGDIYRGLWPAHFADRTGTVFSYAMNNTWNTNYEAGQGGETELRYVVTSAPSTDPVALSRMGWEEATPLESDEITRQDKAADSPRTLNGTQGRFLEIDDPDVVVEAWKPAEDGKGTILRLLDLGSRERSVTVRTALMNLSGAVETDAVERDQHALPLEGTHGFRVSVHPHEIVTVRMLAKDATAE